MTDFDERSGIVPCQTHWGKWWQTIDDVFIEIHVPEGTRSGNIGIDFKPTFLNVTISGKVLIEGALFNTIHAEDALWTLEDKKLVQICMTKTDKTAKNAWKSLLVGQYEVDPLTFDSMEQKLTLQRFQLENPAMDFSNAEVTGQYHGGGPEFQNS